VVVAFVQNLSSIFTETIHGYNNTTTDLYYKTMPQTQPFDSRTAKPFRIAHFM